MKSILVLGARVSRADFFGCAETWRCLEGHGRPTVIQERCELDGTPFSRHAEWVPTSSILEWARKSGFTTAEDWWTALQGDPTPELPLGRYSVAPTQLRGELGDEEAEVLGLRVGGIDEHRPAYSSLDLAALLKLEAWISLHLGPLGLGQRPVLLWTALVFP